MTILAAASEASSGLRILIGLALLVTLALVGSSRWLWSWRRSALGATLTTGGWIAVGIGMVVGPHALKLVDAAHVDVLRPLILFCLGWVGLMVGLQLRGDIPKLLPKHTIRGSLLDALLSVAVLGGVAFVVLRYVLDIDAVAPAVVLSVVLGACGVGWSAETRSLSSHRANLARPAAVLRAISGLASVGAIAVFGLMSMAIRHDNSLIAITPGALGVGLAVSVVTALVCGLLGYWMMNLAGHGQGEFLVVLLGLVAFAAGAAATMAVSALFVGMVIGIVIVNLPGSALKRFQRVIVDAEQPIGMALMLTAGVVADPTMGWRAWALVGALLVGRLLVKGMITPTLIGAVEPAARRTSVMVGPLRQAPLAIALATAYAIGGHEAATGKLLPGGQLVMVVIALGLLSDLTPMISRLAQPGRWSSDLQPAAAAPTEGGEA